MTLSWQQPDLKRIQGEIPGVVGLTLEVDNLWSRGYWLRTRLMDQKSRGLVILDDVWKALDDQEKLGIPCGRNQKYQRKVIFTMCVQYVCEEMGAQKIMEVGSLSHV